MVRIKRAVKVTALGALAGALLSSGVAFADPTPNRGPVSGGTTVSVEKTGIGFTNITGSNMTSVGLGTDGNTYVWGLTVENLEGDPALPVAVKMPAGVTLTKVAAAATNGPGPLLGLGSDGNIYGGGDNSHGQLGNGEKGGEMVLVPVKALAPEGVTFTDVASGREHSLAIGSNGKTYAWGRNFQNQLGDGTNVDSTTPVEVTLPEGVTFTQVAAGRWHSAALGSDGAVYVWGNDLNGMGMGDDPDQYHWPAPTKVPTPTGVTFTSVVAGNTATAAIGSDGNTYVWGQVLGGLGNGEIESSSPVPVTLPTGVTFTEIAVGHGHWAALGSDGEVYTWGGSYKDLADRLLEPVKFPMPEGLTITGVDVSSSATFAFASDGNTYAWGTNTRGQIAAGEAEQIETPTSITDVEVTKVTFGGVAGTDLTIDPSQPNTWTVSTPAHEAGAVDVVVTYTQFGREQLSTYSGGFVYEGVAGSTPTPSGSPTSKPSGPTNSSPGLPSTGVSGR